MIKQTHTVLNIYIYIYIYILIETRRNLREFHSKCNINGIIENLGEKDILYLHVG